MDDYSNDYDYDNDDESSYSPPPTSNEAREANFTLQRYLE